MPTPLPGKMSGWALRQGVLCWLLMSVPVPADVSVTTLGGGPIMSGGAYYGYYDGDTLAIAQFHSPFGCAVDSAGNLFVADRDNRVVRKLDLKSNRTSTFAYVSTNISQLVSTHINQPVAVLFDPGNNLYILNQGSGTLLLFDIYGNYSLVASNLAKPTAMAIDAFTNIYLTELGGAIKRVSSTNGALSPVTSGLSQPQGIAVLQSGLLAVSETASHSLRILDPATGLTRRQIGTNGPGFRDGPMAIAQFNQPWQLAAAPNGGLVVADRGNNRVRLVNTAGIVTTLYGTNQDQWISDYPGWEDGAATVAEARDPVGVTVAPDGTVYTTEDYYHIIRKVSGANLTSIGGAAGGTGANLAVNPPVISPSSGYFPMGQNILVTSSNSSIFFPSVAYYTTDGTEPTTNSQPVQLSNDMGIITWRATDRSLASLRVKAFLGNAPSATVSGQKVANSQIGIPGSIMGGINSTQIMAGLGSTVIVPVVVNLRSNDVLRTLQFRVQFTPETATMPILSNAQVLSSTNEPFIPISGPAASMPLLTLSPICRETRRDL